jgi:hypothetical protein
MARRSPRTVVGSLVTLAVISWIAAAVPAASAAVPSPVERRLALRPLYDALRVDARFAALCAEYDRRGDSASLDRLLRYMKISPLDYLEIDMTARHYEVAVSRAILERHRRWLVLHPELALRWWGRAALDEARGRAARAGKEEFSLQETAAAVGPNRDPAFDEATDPESWQQEIQIGVNPHDLDQVVAAANTGDTTSACTSDQEIQGIFHSSDGGVSWKYTCAPGVPEFVSAGLIPGSGLGSCTVRAFGSDPDVDWNDHGEVFVNYLLVCDRAAGVFSTLVVARSADGGASWTPQGVISNGFGSVSIDDKNFYAVDDDPASPYYGRHYACWDRNQDEKFAYSTTNGASWTEVDLPSGNDYWEVSCDIAVQKNGTVHVAYSAFKTSPPIDAKIFYTRSTDGGASWSTPVEVRDLKLVAFTSSDCPPAQNNRCIIPFGSIAVDNSGGVCDGAVYLTFTDYTAAVTDSDVYVTRSTDHGAHWNAAVRVNDVATGTQFHSFLVEDQDNGDPVVAWHDTRNDVNNKKVDFFVSRSKDCGQTWEANTRVSANSSEFDNSGISYSDDATTDNPLAFSGQYGEYLGLDVRSGRAYVAWTDSRQFFPSAAGPHHDQRENVAFALVDFGDLFSDGFETSSTSAWSGVGP